MTPRQFDERVLAFSLGAVPVTALAAADGGFFSSAWPWTTMALAAAGGIAVLLRRRIVIARLEVVTIGALVGFAAWTALSASWSGDSAQSLREAERALIYVAGLSAALAILQDEELEWMLAGLVTAITGIAVVSVATGPREIGLLEGPVGYANALGILVVLALFCVAGLAETSVGVGRVSAVAATPVLLLTLVLTGSRGAWLALAAGLVAALAVARPRIALVVAPVGAVAVAGALAIGDLGDRPYYWRAAWEQYTENPLKGSGAGTFDEYWLRLRPDDLSVLDTPQVLDAHNLYLETLAELGPLGLALVVIALAAPVVAAWRVRGERSLVWAGGAYVSFLTHAGLDWDWEMPVVTLAALICAAALLCAGRPDRAPAAGGRARMALLSGFIALIVTAITTILS